MNRFQFQSFFIPLLIKRNFSLELAEKLGQNERQAFVINGLGKNFAKYIFLSILKQQVARLLINGLFLFWVKQNVLATIFSS